jgi:hypothetical protein
MAMTPEGKVKKVVRKHLDSINDDWPDKYCYYFMPATGGYGKSGVPDIVGCYNGIFFGIELKAGNNRPTPLQKKNLSQINMAHGIALVINEKNMDYVITILEARSRDIRKLYLDYNDKSETIMLPFDAITSIYKPED